MFTLHSIRLVGASSVLIKCAKGHNLAIDASEESALTAGSFYTRFVSILNQDSKISFSTYAIDQILALTGLIGSPIGAALTYTSAELYFACYDRFGQILSGSNHVKVTINRGFLAWSTINCQTNQDAEAACEMLALDPESGILLPIEVATSAALPTPVAADDTRFSISKATLGGIAIDCIQSMNINAGRTLEFRRCSSDVYSKQLRSSPIKPTISISTQDTTALSAAKIPFVGKACTHANTSLFFRKRLNNLVGYELDATAAHVKFTAAGLARISDHQSNVPDPGASTINVTTIDDGTNAPIVATTGVAIT